MNTAVLGHLRSRLSGVVLSRRERVLGLGMILVACFLWAFSAFESASSARSLGLEVRAQLRLEERRQAALASQAFQAAVGRQAQMVRAWSLVEPTVSLGQMRAQSQLEDFAIAAGVGHPEIIVDQPGQPLAGMQQLTLAIEGDFTWDSFLLLLSYIENAETSIVPLGIDVSNSETQPRFNMTFAFAYLLPREGL